jgi:hypothetical protein
MTPFSAEVFFSFCLVTERVEVLPSAWSLSLSKCCLVPTKKGVFNPDLV